MKIGLAEIPHSRILPEAEHFSEEKRYASSRILRGISSSSFTASVKAGTPEASLPPYPSSDKSPSLSVSPSLEERFLRGVEKLVTGLDFRHQSFRLVYAPGGETAVMAKT